MERVICALAVHYNNSAEVVAFARHLRSVPLPQGWRLDICLADNSQNWPEEEGQHGMMVSRPDGNLGYLNGCAFALSEWRRHTAAPNPQFALVCNTDVRFEPDAIELILRERWPKETALIAPSIQTTTGLLQNPFLRTRPSRGRIFFLRTVFGGRAWRYGVDRFVRSNLYPRWKSLRGAFGQSRLHEADATSELQTIYAAHGSAMFMTETFFLSGCSLAIDWEMFGEEIHLAEQLRNVGLSTVWYPRAQVTHEVSSTLSVVDRERVVKWRAEALDGLWNKYFRHRD